VLRVPSLITSVARQRRQRGMAGFGGGRIGMMEGDTWLLQS
jgi:hypothetical protein